MLTNNPHDPEGCSHHRRRIVHLAGRVGSHRLVADRSCLVGREGRTPKALLRIEVAVAGSLEDYNLGVAGCSLDHMEGIVGLEERSLGR